MDGAGVETTGAVPPPRPQTVEWKTAIRCAALVAAIAAVLTLVAERVQVVVAAEPAVDDQWIDDHAGPVSAAASAGVDGCRSGSADWGGGRPGAGGFLWSGAGGWRIGGAVWTAQHGGSGCAADGGGSMMGSKRRWRLALNRRRYSGFGTRRSFEPDGCWHR